MFRMTGSERDDRIVLKNVIIYIYNLIIHLKILKCILIIDVYIYLFIIYLNI